MISIIIPIYNKGSVLLATLNRLIFNLNKSNYKDFEIIIIDDGSKDDSFFEAFRFKRTNKNFRKIKIFHYEKNVGKGFALKYGFYKSHGDPIVFLDGDMDIDTKQVIHAINIFERCSPNILIGSKYHPRSRLYYPFKRYFYSRILKIFIKLLFNFSVSDTQVGFKIFRRKVLTQVFPKIIIKRFAVDMEILLVANQLGFKKIKEIPIIIRHSNVNASTINYKAGLFFIQDVLALYYRKNILRYYG